MPADPSLVNDLFARHYLFFSFLAGLGAIQIAVSISSVRGMWLLPSRLATRWLGVLLIVAGVAIFFMQPLWVEGPWAEGSVEADSSTRMWGTSSWGELAGARNVNDIDGGVSGTGQATWFPLGIAFALIASLVVGTINMRLFPPTPNAAQMMTDGLGAMRQRSYPAALRFSWDRFRRSRRREVREAVDEAPSWSIAGMIRRLVRR